MFLLDTSGSMATSNKLPLLQQALTLLARQLRPADRVAIVANGRIIVEGRPDALIRTHLAPEVVEVDCAPDEEAALLDGTVPPRHGLRVGRRVMLYVDDASPLVERMHQRDPSNQRALVVRPTNLEDVYLRLTGTSLEAA